MRGRQQGVTLAMFLVVFALVAVAFLASYSLSRLTGARDERESTRTRLEKAAVALEHFVASNERLPCPANPEATAATENGVEVRDPGNTKRCAHITGTLPWRSLGLKRDDGYDGWGRRISYRVYTGIIGTGAHSLTQDYGATMVQCDTVENSAGQTSADGICVRSNDPLQRTTRDTVYLGGKGLTINDMGTSYSDAAFVLISHGASGRGAYTSSGTRVEMPSGVEASNTTANFFTIQRFSDPETSPKAGTYFDDVLVYRRLEDMLKRLRLVARDWPDPASLAGSILFNSSTVNAATGSNVSGNDSGSAILDFGGAYVVGVSGNNTANISIDRIGGTDGIGVVGGGNPKMSYSEGEWLYVQFDLTQTRFGITLNDFGTYTSGTRSYVETVYLAFYLDGSSVGTPVLASACRSDGGLASFDYNVNTNYNAVLVFPYQATASQGPPGDSAFLLSEVRTCPSTDTNCRTSLWQTGNACN